MPTRRSWADAEPLKLSAAVIPPTSARTAASTVSLVRVVMLGRRCAGTCTRSLLGRPPHGQVVVSRCCSHAGRATSARYIRVASPGKSPGLVQFLDDQRSAPDAARVVHDLAGEQAAVQRPELVVVDERGHYVGGF